VDAENEANLTFRFSLVTAMLEALDRWHDISTVIQQGTRAEAAEKLQGPPFEFTAMAAEHVLTMRLEHLTSDQRAKLRREEADLRRALKGTA
jgi:DNA gyrase/topoisomerase IV subunit A